MAFDWQQLNHSLQLSNTFSWLQQDEQDMLKSRKVSIEVVPQDTDDFLASTFKASKVDDSS